ncbi:MAG: hypothetical protein AABX12_00045 [Nanoarchaeota archaeon]
MNKKRLLTVGAGILITVSGLGVVSTSKSEFDEYRTQRKHDDISELIGIRDKIISLEGKLGAKPNLRDLYDSVRVEEIKGWLDEYAMMQVSQAKMLEDEEFKSKWNRFNTRLKPNYYIRTYSALALCASGLLAFGALVSKKS